MSDLNKSIRLKTTPGGEDKNLSIKLEQNFDFLEVLSLKISQKDLYDTFCANYGVVVGRVLANKGFGVPNAKVSIFIPITDEDETNELIKDLYPYKSITDKDKNGYRYNLLLSSTVCSLNKPTGTFPNKQTLLNNDIWIEVFEKYYKYTTRTNKSGDYMLFGVPVGSKTLHVDVDLSDAGLLSVRPYDLISQGAPKDFFDSPTQFKVSSNLDILPQIKSVNRGVDIIPFWGDPESCEIGITRVDIDTNTELEPTALFTGSIFSDKEKASLNKKCNPKNRQGELDELRTGAGTIKFIRAKRINPEDWVDDKKVVPIELETFDIDDGQVIDEDGTFNVVLPMNVGRVITDEAGDLIPSPDQETGLPTKAAYRMKMSFNEPPSNRKRRTANMIFPSLSEEHGGSAGYTSTGDVADINGTEDQRFTDNILDYKTSDDSLLKDFHIFEWKQLYTIAQYIKKYKKGPSRWSFLGLKNNDKEGAYNNPLPYNTAIKKNDILFSLLSFAIKINAFFIKFLIILIGLEFGFYLGLGISFTIFKQSFCIFQITAVLRIGLFTWVGDILPKFANDDNQYCEDLHEGGRGFVLECGDDATFCICTGGGGGCDVCGPNGGIPCKEIQNLEGDNGCTSGSNCESFGSFTLFQVARACGCPCRSNGSFDNPNQCQGCINLAIICLKPYVFFPNADNCDAIGTIDKWKCCVISNLAEQRNVIRRSLFDSWIVGTAYLFQYKYKSKIRKKNGELVLKEKFCGPGSDTKGGNNYCLNQCCPHDDGSFTTSNGQTETGKRCAKCLIRGGGETDKPVSKIEDYHRFWHNKTVSGNCDGYGCGNGATDIGDNIYCNNYNSTKIVSLGRVEMCPDTLNEIEKCIEAQECVFDLYKQNPDFYTGTFFENGWDPNFWVNEMGTTSYQDPIEVIRYLLGVNDGCKVSKLFDSGQGCHENELTNDSYRFMKEISKIYTDIITGQIDVQTDLEEFSPDELIIADATTNPIEYEEDDDGNPLVSGFELDPRLGQRFSPCGGTSGLDCDQPPLPWSGEDLQTNTDPEYGPDSTHNASKNIPYYYFGLTPGKSSIDKLRKEFFTN